MNYDEWAADAEASKPGSRCSICTNEKAAADFQRFVEDSLAGRINITLTQFWREYLKPTYGVGADSTARRHLQVCLGIKVLSPKKGAKRA